MYLRIAAVSDSDLPLRWEIYLGTGAVISQQILGKHCVNFTIQILNFPQIVLKAAACMELVKCLSLPCSCFLGYSNKACDRKTFGKW